MGSSFTIIRKEPLELSVEVDRDISVEISTGFGGGNRGQFSAFVPVTVNQLGEVVKELTKVYESLKTAKVCCNCRLICAAILPKGSGKASRLSSPPVSCWTRLSRSSNWMPNMPLLDTWHGYSQAAGRGLSPPVFADIAITRDGVTHQEACNAKIIQLGENSLIYQTSPFAGRPSANMNGNGWHRTVTPVTQKLAPYVPMNICEVLFEVLVDNKLAKVSEWSNFHYCLGQKYLGSTFVDVDCRAGAGLDSIRFTHSAWEVLVGHKPLHIVEKRLVRANDRLAELRLLWQNENDPAASGWMKWELDCFGIRNG